MTVLPMARMRFKPSKLTLFISLVLLGFIFLLTPQNITSRLNFAFVGIFRYFLNVGSSAVYYQPSENSKVSPYFVPRHEYDKLWVAFTNLQSQIGEQKKEIEELGKVRMTEPDPATGLVLAKIVNRRKQEFIINKGTADGLANGQYVLGDNAVIGSITQASADISSVRLITSSGCKLAVKISAPDADIYFNGTMAGDDKNGARIPNVPKKYDIREGYYVYASAKPGFLQSPRIVGRVSKCAVDQSNPVLWEIDIAPAYNFDNLTDVAIIVLKTGID